MKSREFRLSIALPSLEACFSLSYLIVQGQKGRHFQGSTERELTLGTESSFKMVTSFILKKEEQIASAHGSEGIIGKWW